MYRIDIQYLVGFKVCMLWTCFEYVSIYFAGSPKHGFKPLTSREQNTCEQSTAWGNRQHIIWIWKFYEILTFRPTKKNEIVEIA